MQPIITPQFNLGVEYTASVGRSRPILAAIGDSRMGSEFIGYAAGANHDLVPADSQIASGHYTANARTWAGFMSFGAIDISQIALQTFNGTQINWVPSYNKAVGGTTTSELVYQVANLLTVSPKATHCLIISGTNYIYSNVTDNATGLACLATMKADFIAAWTMLRQNGIVPITLVEFPREWAGNAYKQKTHQQFRNWQRQAAEYYGSWVVDSAWRLADISNANGDPLAANYIVETPKIHPGTLGAKLVATDIIDLLVAKGVIPYSLPASYGMTREDVYDATLTPQGNLLGDAGLMLGTTGSKGGTPAPTGDVPTGWTLRNDNSAADFVAVSALQARTNGQGNDVLLTVSECPNACNFMMYKDITTNIATGDIVWGAADVFVDASSGLNAVDHYLADMSSASTFNQFLYGIKTGSVNVSNTPPTIWSGRSVTDKMQLYSPGTRLRFAVYFFLAAGATLTARIGAAEVRKAFSAL